MTRSEISQHHDGTESAVWQSNWLRKIQLTAAAAAVAVAGVGIAVNVEPDQPTDVIEATVDFSPVAASSNLPDCPSVTAHRGSLGPFKNKPGKDFTTEDTVWAARRAIFFGVNRVETDFHLNKSGKAWSIHDATVNRTTNGAGLVRHKSDRQMRRLRTKDGTGVPSYSSYLNNSLKTSWAENRAHPKRTKQDINNVAFQIELKSRFPQSKINDMVRQLHKTGRFGASQFTTSELTTAKNVRQADPTASIGLINRSSGRPDVSRLVANSASIDMTMVDHSAVTKNLVKTLATKGIQVSARGVNTQNEAKEMIRDGVTNIVTDNARQINQRSLAKAGMCKIVKAPSINPTPAPSPSPSPTESAPPSESASPTPTESASPTATVSPTASASVSPAESASPSATITP